MTFVTRMLHLVIESTFFFHFILSQICFTLLIKYTHLSPNIQFKEKKKKLFLNGTTMNVKCTFFFFSAFSSDIIHILCVVCAMNSALFSSFCYTYMRNKHTGQKLCTFRKFDRVGCSMCDSTIWIGVFSVTLKSIIFGSINKSPKGCV